MTHDEIIRMAREAGFHLVNLWYAADSSNKLRVRAAFPEYFDKYERMYLEWKKST
jgi:hypothetical protein